jgi:hypothetical protein
MFLFFSVTSIECNSQRGILDKKKNGDLFLKWLLNKRQEKNVSTKPIELSMGTLWRMRKEIKFSGRDSLDIQLQIEENNKATFDSTLSPNKSFLEKTRIEDEYLKISRPIYFANGKKLWVYIEHYCGDTCGEGFIQVYEINKKGYTLLFHISTWIS